MNNKDGNSYVFTTPYLPPISWWQRWVDAGMPDLGGDVPFGRHAGLNRALIDSPNGPLTITIPIAGKGDPHLITPRVVDAVPMANSSPLEEGRGGARMLLSHVMMSSHGDWRHKHWHALESAYFNSPYFEYYYDDFAAIYQGDEQMLWRFNLQLIELVARLVCLNDPGVLAVVKEHRLSRRGETYYQVFAHRHPFVHDMSIVDLLFNMGPESIYWIA